MFTMIFLWNDNNGKSVNKRGVFMGKKLKHCVHFGAAWPA
jgi:hypothetical protein